MSMKFWFDLENHRKFDRFARVEVSTEICAVNPLSAEGDKSHKWDIRTITRVMPSESSLGCSKVNVQKWSFLLKKKYVRPVLKQAAAWNTSPTKAISRRSNI